MGRMALSPYFAHHWPALCGAMAPPNNARKSLPPNICRWCALVDSNHRPPPCERQPSFWEGANNCGSTALQAVLRDATDCNEMQRRAAVWCSLVVGMVVRQGRSQIAPAIPLNRSARLVAATGGELGYDPIIPNHRSASRTRPTNMSEPKNRNVCRMACSGRNVSKA